MKTRVLILDDEPMSTYFLSTLLEGEGYETRYAHCERDALEVATEMQPHLVLSDILLRNGESGIEVMEKLLEIVPECPVIFMTGLSLDSVKEAKRIPFKELLQKPIDIDTLLQAIENALQEALEDEESSNSQVARS